MELKLSIHSYEGGHGLESQAETSVKQVRPVKPGGQVQT